jgi:hypothetical protein
VAQIPAVTEPEPPAPAGTAPAAAPSRSRKETAAARQQAEREQELGALRLRVLQQQNTIDQQQEAIHGLNRQLRQAAREQARPPRPAAEETALRERLRLLEGENHQLALQLAESESRQREAREQMAAILAVLPKLEFVDGSLEVLCSIPSTTQVLGLLRDLAGDSGSLRGVTVHSAPAFKERHFNPGIKRDSGRLYYAPLGGGRYRVLVALKKSEQDQQRDIEKLKRAAPRPGRPQQGT